MGPPALRSARLVTVAAPRGSLDYLDKPSHPSRRRKGADTERTNQENCQPCIRSIVSCMFPVAQSSASISSNRGSMAWGRRSLTLVDVTLPAVRVNSRIPNRSSGP